MPIADTIINLLWQSNVSNLRSLESHLFLRCHGAEVVIIQGEGCSIMSVSLQFCGAAKTVTGSCYWLTTDSCSPLVDFGMFQGTKTIKELNYGEFPFVANEIDFVSLTHAHTDHAGLLPKLCKAGFPGQPI